MLKRVYISCELNAPLHTTKKNGIDTPMSINDDRELQ